MNSAARRPPSPGPATTAAQAAAALADRRAVVLPVEGTLALAAAAETAAGDLVALLARGAGGLVPAFYLSPDTEACERALSPLAAGIHRRLVRRLTPGPALFVEPEGGARFSLMHEGRAIGFTGLMCTAEPVTLAALARVAFPVVAAEIQAPGGGPAVTPDEAAATLTQLRIDALPAPAGPISRTVATVIELLPPGAAARAGVPFRVVRAGGYEERFIRKQLALNVLFVCTGNTCRSPMAEAIANALVQSAGRAGEGDSEGGGGGGGVGGGELRFSSAGTAAAGSAPPSPEAVRALRELDVAGGLAGHRSRALTRRMIEEADAIYTMGRSHAQAVLELSPDAEGRVRTLDPDGGDVPDPIGMSQDVYTTTARRIMEMVRRRLKELGS